jgi:hypothetical protein
MNRIGWVSLCAFAALLSSCGGSGNDDEADRRALLAQGREIFRFDTFGDEAKWTDTLRMHEVIAAVRASLARSAIRLSTTHSRPASASGSTAGLTAT